MDLKVHPIVIDPDQPFISDRLNRKEEVENLTLLLRNLNSPATLAVDSGWGTGKTTFIQMLAANLKLQGVPSLYFNAWNTDFVTDPLVAFLGEMDKGLEDLIGGSEKSKQAWSTAKKLGTQIAKRGLPALIQVGTAGVTDTDKIIEDGVAKVLEGRAGNVLKAYEEHMSAILDFKKSLNELIQGSSGNIPVVIFVDELDRCRPNYALDLLERIKHLFDVEGLVFVLALDRSQLGHSIRTIYGNGLDSDGYLRRFIDFDYSLKKPEMGKYISCLYETLGMKSFFEARSKYNIFQYDWKHLSGVFELLAQAYNFSLRDAEQLLARINLALCATQEKQYIHPALLVFLVVIRDKNCDLYKDYISENGNASSAIKYLHSLIPYGERIESLECALIEGFLIAGKKTSGTSELSELSKYKEVTESENSSQEEKDYAVRVINIVRQSLKTSREIHLEDLSKRVDMLGHFQFPGDKDLPTAVR